jgi:hypothetical protein
VTYDALPGITTTGASSLPVAPTAGEQAERVESASAPPARGSRRARRPAAAVTDETEAAAVTDETELDSEDPQQLATRLLERALRLGQEKDDADWLHSSAVKSQMRRMDPSFSEKALGYRSFSDFVKSRQAVAELDETNPVRLVRLNPAMTAQ